MATYESVIAEIRRRHEKGCVICGKPMHWQESDIEAVSEDEFESAELALRYSPNGFVHEECWNLPRELRDAKERAVRMEYRIREITERIQKHDLYYTSALVETFANTDLKHMADNKDSFGFAQSWVMDGPCVWISGEQGHGKTYLAHCILNKHLQNGVYIGEINAADLLNKSKGWEADDFVKMVSEIELLLLDDVDKIPLDNRAVETLWNILDKRYKKKHKTICTSNYDGKAVIERLLTIKNINRTAATSSLDRLNFIGKPCRKIAMVGCNMRREREINA